MKTTLRGRGNGPFVYKFDDVELYNISLVGQVIFFCFVPALAFGYGAAAIALAVTGLVIHFGAIACDMGIVGLRELVSGWTFVVGAFLFPLGGTAAWLILAAGDVEFPMGLILLWSAAIIVLSLKLWPQSVRPWWRKRPAGEAPAGDNAYDKLKRLEWLRRQLTHSEFQKLSALPLTEQMHLLDQALPQVREALRQS